MMETLIDRQAAWLSNDGPDLDIVLNSQCRLVRNLAEFPFPSQCSTEERRLVEERLLSVFESLNLLTSGKYWSLESMDPTEARFLAERRLISWCAVDSEGPRGAHISDDQSISLVVNGENHLTILVLAAGQQIQDVWSRANLVDDTLAGVLDFAFNERLGYLTTSLADVGTGLKAEVVLHLPALAMRGELAAVEQEVGEKRHTIECLFGTPKEALGDLYRLSNATTLGRSEEECLFHLKHLTNEIVNREREARQQINQEIPMQLEDRVWRAVGLARRARLMTFDEALSVLSSLRIGVAERHVDHYTLPQLNDALIACQNAHLELRRGHECDELTLNTERADLFRARFA